MRPAPSNELPPNLKATTLRICLASPPAQCTRWRNAAGRGSAAASSGTFSRLMTCAPGFPLRLQPLERLWRGLKRRNPPPGRFWRWVGNFLLVRLLFLHAPEAEIVVLVVVEV